MYLLFGQYGPYVQRGQVSDENPKPKRASLPKGAKPEDLSLEDALGLLRLPRLLGEHPDGGKIQAGLGRFGPYVVWDKGKGEKDYRSLKGRTMCCWWACREPSNSWRCQNGGAVVAPP